MGHQVHAGELVSRGNWVEHEFAINTSAAAAIASSMIQHVMPPRNDLLAEDGWYSDNSILDNQYVKLADYKAPWALEEFLIWMGYEPTIRSYTREDFNVARDFVHQVALTDHYVYNCN